VSTPGNQPSYTVLDIRLVAKPVVFQLDDEIFRVDGS
jgi:hypothetical protein